MEPICNTTKLIRMEVCSTTSARIFVYYLPIKNLNLREVVVLVKTKWASEYLHWN
jgi:hypothetical protein